MGIALPKTATKIHKITGRNNDLERIIGTIYYYYLRLLVSAKAYKINRKQAAPIKPLKLIQVDPKKIKAHSKDKPYTNHLFPKIEDGNWDLKPLDLVDNSNTTLSLYQHFNKGYDWEDTKFYKEHKKKFEKGETQYARNTSQSFEQKLARIDKLYQNIKENGYKKQKELPKNKISVNDKIDHHLKEFNEVTVNIGRNGEILKANGAHRAIIAQILNIEKIPVRILVRHKKWQEKRNQAVKNLEKLSEEDRNHPDIKSLLK